MTPSLQPALPAAVLLRSDGTVLSATEGARGWVGGDDVPRLRFGPIPLDLSRACVALGWVEDDGGARLPVQAEVVLTAAGALVLLVAPGHDGADSALHRAFIHDLRAPVATAHLLAQSLNAELARQPPGVASIGAGYLLRMEQELARVSTMIGFLRLIRPGWRRPAIASELGAAVAATVRRLGRGLQRSGVLLTHEPGPLTPIYTEIDTLHALIGALITLAGQGGEPPVPWIRCRHGVSEGAPFVEIVAPQLSRLRLDLSLSPGVGAPEQASWLEIGLMAAAWLARREGGTISHGPGADGECVALILRLPAA